MSLGFEALYKKDTGMYDRCNIIRIFDKNDTLKKYRKDILKLWQALEEVSRKQEPIVKLYKDSKVTDKDIDELINGGSYFLLLELDGKIIGYCCIARDNGMSGVNFSEFFLDPTYRGQSIGKRFFLDVLESIKKDNPHAKNITTGVLIKNTVAKYLYEANGFEAYHISLFKKI